MNENFRPNLLLRLIAVIAFFILGAAIAYGAETPVVSTAFGKVLGSRIGHIDYFKGIPFAAPPVGDRRWQPPQPPKPWEPIFNATEYGKPCPQKQNFEETSEDCLTINVSTPSNRASDAHLPVLVWIHGGGFVSGTGSTDWYKSDVWVSKGVIFVTFNYRLGLLGFFDYSAIDGQASRQRQGANFGLMDMAAALKWVNQNIVAFGGDPNKVTIAGLSAGAMAVQTLMVSPLAKGLFSRAIAESGYATWPLPRSEEASKLKGSASSREIAQSYLNKLAQGISQDNIEQHLKSVSTKALVDAVEGFHLPIVDNVTLEDEPGILFARGEQNRVPYMSGGASFDGSVYPESGINADQLLALTGSEKQKLKKIYDIKEPYNQDDRPIQMLFGDLRYLFAGYYTTQNMRRINQPGYRYLFNYRTEEEKAHLPGAPHGSDAALLFYDNKTSIANTMRSYWLNFIKNGDPNGEGLLYWPTTGEDENAWMVFSESPEWVKGIRREKLTLIEKAYLKRVRKQLPKERK